MVTFFDAFAGAGGFHLALSSVGFECVGACEIDKFARHTYRTNFEYTPVWEDMSNLPYDELPDFDILTGGFPCQSFSTAGQRKGFDDPRGNLMWDMLELVKRKQPKAVIFENVKGFTTAEDGKYVKALQDELSSMGYSSTYKVLNSKNFGLPQSRERMYMLATNQTVFGVPAADMINLPEKPLFSEVSTPRVGDILEESVHPKYTLSDKMWVWLAKRAKDLEERGSGFNAYTLVDADTPYTRTIPKRYYKDGKEALLVQEGKNPRRLTPREIARLQGFPDSFRFPVSDTQAYQQMGNAISVPVAKNVALRLCDLFSWVYFGLPESEMSTRVFNNAVVGENNE